MISLAASSARALPRARRDRRIIAVFALLFAAFTLPVLWFRFPELLDYPNHLGRMYALAKLPSDPLLGRFYDIRWHLVPNLAMDLLVPPLAKLVGVFVAGKLFVLLTLLLLATGPFAIAAALYRRWSPWPLIAFIFLFNGIFVVGFTNYLFGLGVSLWAVAAWIALRDAPWPTRLGVALLCAIILFVSHLFALGVYGLGILCFELHRAARRHARSDAPLFSAADAAVFVLPFLVCAGFLFASRTGGDAGLIAWDLSGKTTGIMFAFEIFSKPVAIGTLVVLAGAMLWGWKSRQLRAHPVGVLVLSAGLFLFVAMPFQLFGSAFADARLPIAIIFLAIGMMEWRPATRVAGLAAAACLGLVIAIRLVDAVAGLSHYARTYADFEQSFQMIQPGSRILTASLEGNPQRLSSMLTTHMPVLAMAERSSLVSTAFTDPGQQVLETRRSLRPYVGTVGWPPRIPYLLASEADPEAMPDGASQRPFYSGWREHYDYLYVLFAQPGTRIPDPSLSLLYEGSDFQLYAVRPATARAAGGQHHRSER